MDWLITMLLMPFAIPLAIGYVSMCCCVSVCPTHVADTFNRGSLGSDWTVVSGSISMPGTVARTTSANALVIHASASSNHIWIKGRFSLTTAGDEAKLVCAYTDSDNYLFATFRRDGVTTLFKRVGGVDTQLGSAVTGNSFVALQWATLSFDGNTLCAVSIGGDGGTLEGVNTCGQRAAAYVDETMSGTGMGFGAGALTGTCDLDEFNATGHDIDNSLCPTCCICNQCTPQQTVRELEVVISGVANAGACLSPNCAAVLNNTFILAQTVNLCVWVKSLAPAGCPAHNTITAGTAGAGTLEVGSSGATGGTSFRATVSTNCATWNAESLAPVNAGFFECDHSSATCTVSAI